MSCTVPVPGTGLEEGVVGVEYLPADDDIPLPEQPASVLPLLTWTHQLLTHQLLTLQLLTHQLITHQLLTHQLITHQLLTHQLLTHQLLTHQLLTLQLSNSMYCEGIFWPIYIKKTNEVFFMIKPYRTSR
jgi:hypothetical protein